MCPEAGPSRCCLARAACSTPALWREHSRIIGQPDHRGARTAEVASAPQVAARRIQPTPCGLVGYPPAAFAERGVHLIGSRHEALFRVVPGYPGTPDTQNWGGGSIVFARLRR